jgi:adenine-specific DNA glycosylase
MEAFPHKAKRASTRDLQVEVGLFRRGEELLFSRGERPLLKGLWNLPWRVVAAASDFEPESWPELGLRLGATQRLGECEHRITRYRIRQRIIAGEAHPTLGEAMPEYRWVRADEREALGLPAFSARVLALLSTEEGS